MQGPRRRSPELHWNCPALGRDAMTGLRGEGSAGEGWDSGLGSAQGPGPPATDVPASWCAGERAAEAEWKEMMWLFYMFFRIRHFSVLFNSLKH